MKSTLDTFFATLKYDTKTDKYIAPSGEVFDGLAQAKESFTAQGMTAGMRLCLIITKEAQTPTKKHKIYCFNNGGSYGWMQAVAFGDDGIAIAGHTCTCEAYMRHDLGMDGSDWKHDVYNEHFGVGNWELEWVDDPLEHKGIQDALIIGKERQPEPKTT